MMSNILSFYHMYVHVYTILPTYLEKDVPLVFCFLLNKGEETNIKALQVVKDKLQEYDDLSPDDHLLKVSFEIVTHDVALQVFHGAWTEFCCTYFYFNFRRLRPFSREGLHRVTPAVKRGLGFLWSHPKKLPI